MPTTIQTYRDTRTHDPKTFDENVYALACRNGACDCAPLCPNCRKVKMWDRRIWPAYHDWVCDECKLYWPEQLWKEA